MSKRKGSNAERELIHLFWAAEWSAVRVAGSGSMKYPAPDILASTPGKSLAIECKATSSNYQYLEKREVEELVAFAALSGAQPVVAVRFSRLPWLFLSPSDLKETGRNFGISRVEAQKKGVSFDDIAKSL